jgi:hypothetical protein
VLLLGELDLEDQLVQGAERQAPAPVVQGLSVVRSKAGGGREPVDAV